MKQCPFCAEEIQDAAVVCKHCGRDLVTHQATPPPPPAETGSGLGFTIFMWTGMGFLLLVVIVLIVSVGGSTPRSITPQEPSLQITGGRNVFGLLITNMGTEPLHSCRIRLFTDNAGLWTAIVDERRTIGLGAEYRFPNRVVSLDITNAEGRPLWVRPIAEAETVDVPWATFQSKGQKLPGYIGQNSESFDISCNVGDDRRSATLRF